MQSKVHHEFSIILESNPTTGFSWEAVSDPGFVKLTQQSFQAAPSGPLGAGGKQIFKFLPLRAGETTIRMRYKRPWESRVGTERSFRIVIEE